MDYREADDAALRRAVNGSYPRVPSFKRLAVAFGEDKARAVRDVLTGKVDPETIERTAAWVRQCYHRPSWRELTQHACDAILGNFGTEAIQDRNGHIVAVYSNTGDSYAMTLVFSDHVVSLCDCASWIEGYEKRHGQLP